MVLFWLWLFLLSVTAYSLISNYTIQRVTIRITAISVNVRTCCTNMYDVYVFIFKLNTMGTPLFHRTVTPFFENQLKQGIDMTMAFIDIKCCFHNCCIPVPVFCSFIGFVLYCTMSDLNTLQRLIKPSRRFTILSV